MDLLKIELTRHVETCGLALKLLKEIYEALGGPDGEPEGFNATLGIPTQYFRLPKRVAMMVDQRGDAEAEMPREKQIRPMPVGAAAEKTPDDTIEIVQAAKYVGQEWCQTDSKCDGCAVVAFPFRDAPSIVLCEVRKCVETGELIRTPIPITELPQV